MGSATASNTPHSPIRIRMLKTVTSDLPFISKRGVVLYRGEEYTACSNKNGAISGICENGEALGVRPGEFEFIEAPQWVLDIWKGHGLLEYLPNKAEGESS